MTSQPRTFALIPASYVYLRRDDQVLLQQRINTGYMDGHWAAGAAGISSPAKPPRPRLYVRWPRNSGSSSESPTSAC